MAGSTRRRTGVHLGLHYLHANQIATRAEQAAVRAVGVNWRHYDRFMQKYVKRIGDERLTRVPEDLDTKPYRDEHDDDLLQRMLACISKGSVPAGFRGSQLRDAAREIRQYIRHHETQLPGEAPFWSRGRNEPTPQASDTARLQGSIRWS